ncbi:hypothetical protein L1277_000410 [Okibacterium sp. HSC-33S16]|uniref:hypothetical protein n=1 Tax=Okibacterium sp. HSC-33S16 TaxID=2910965 RepID=UPI00209D9B85|nr:hypothetical protein [Okibacterium sp. HSC-33S16]MCP2030346.1 hypothetical protein [Okibacterium sp. HSC-33S16]
MTEIGDAKVQVEEARAALDAKLPGMIEFLQQGVGAALARMVELAVIEQHKHTATLDPAQLGVLKFNVAEARKSALSAVDGIVDGLDFDSLTSKARSNMSGETFVDASGLLSGLLKPTGDLLESAGYNVSVLKGSSFDDGYRLSAIRGTGFNAEVAARGLDDAIEKYGKAKLALAKTQTAAAQADARSAWDNA